MGASLVAASAAGLGYYFYASKSAKAHRRIAAKWAGDFKRDVIKRAKQVGNLNRASVLATIDTISGAYETARNLKKSDLTRAASELKTHWQEVVREAGKKSAGAKRVVKSAGKKTPKKSGK